MPRNKLSKRKAVYNPYHRPNSDKLSTNLRDAVFASPLNNTTRISDTTDPLKIATWNVGNCIEDYKKDNIDANLHIENTDVACLQGTHLVTGTVVNTLHYCWYVSGGSNKTTTYGVAILVKHSLLKNVFGCTFHSENLMSLKIDIEGVKTVIISSLIPSYPESRMLVCFNDLIRVIPGILKDQLQIILLGDFTAHIGSLDLDKHEQFLVGKNVLHEYTNINGTLLKAICKRWSIREFITRGTESVLVTYQTGTLTSQPDHILATYKFAVENVYGSWPKNVETYHKLVCATAVLKKKKEKPVDKPVKTLDKIPLKKKYPILSKHRLTKDAKIMPQCEKLQEKQVAPSNPEPPHLVWVPVPVCESQVDTYKKMDEVTSQGQTNAPQALKNTSQQQVKFGTWNIRGCTTEDERQRIDHLFYENNIDVGCLQETHLITGSVETEHYNWHLSGGHETQTVRGTAILVAKHMSQETREFKQHSENTASIQVKVGEKEYTILTTHIPSAPKPSMEQGFKEIQQILGNIEQKVILLGNFNAQIGKDELESKDKQLIGRNLYHSISNENGNLLKATCHLYQLTLNTSWATSSSVKTTWQMGDESTQIDHILSNVFPEIRLCQMYGTLGNSIKSGHKLICGVLKPRQPQPRNTSQVEEAIPNQEADLSNDCSTNVTVSTTPSTPINQQ